MDCIKICEELGWNCEQFGSDEVMLRNGNGYIIVGLESFVKDVQQSYCGYSGNDTFGSRLGTLYSRLIIAGAEERHRIEEYAKTCAAYGIDVIYNQCKNLCILTCRERGFAVEVQADDFENSICQRAINLGDVTLLRLAVDILPDDSRKKFVLEMLRFAEKNAGSHEPERKSFTDILRENGFQVFECGNGYEIELRLRGTENFRARVSEEEFAEFAENFSPNEWALNEIVSAQRYVKIPAVLVIADNARMIQEKLLAASRTMREQTEVL